ncbi:MAG: hypothetical protein NUV68_04390 [Caldiserica bacterium]|jgi:ABC-type transporter MlaC component|nr:hypothetical protein [Caldisericota bacterium]MDH7562217.1 hypothetical protein [Caldisericota bacterium]
MDLSFWRDLAIFIIALIFILFTLAGCFVFLVSALALKKAEKALDQKLKNMKDRAQSVKDSTRKLATPISRPFITLVALKEGAKEFLRSFIKP